MKRDYIRHEYQQAVITEGYFRDCLPQYGEKMNIITTSHSKGKNSNFRKNIDLGLTIK